MAEEARAAEATKHVVVVGGGIHGAQAPTPSVAAAPRGRAAPLGRSRAGAGGACARAARPDASPSPCLAPAAGACNTHAHAHARTHAPHAPHAACSAAYHLCQRGARVTLLEREPRVASAASGQAGGFLARDWGDSATSELHEKSFAMHKELAEALGVASYRAIPTLSVRQGRRDDTRVEAPWLDGDVSSAKLMDAPDATAQVTPLELTQKLAEAAAALGCTIRTGVRVVGVHRDGKGGAVSAVRCVAEAADAEEESLECDAVLVAAGVWSTVTSEWFGLGRGAWPLTGIKSTHVVWRARKAVAESPYALFCGEDANGCHLEVYPRPSGDVYVCGIGGSDYVEGDRLREGGDCAAPSMVAANPSRVQAAQRSLSAITSEADGAPDEVGACMRPCAPDARPLMGAVPGVANAYVSAGHNCWGILWAPISGKAMAELILDGKSSVADLAAFAPDRFLPEAQRGGRGRKQGDTAVGEQW